MHRWISSLTLSLGLTLLPISYSVVQARPLQKLELTNWHNLGIDEQLWGNSQKPGDKQALIRSLDNSLYYLSTPSAAKAYRNYPVPGVTLDRVRRSLFRFRQLLLSANSSEELQQKSAREFVLYSSIGNDDRGTVSFTGYFEPVYRASRVPTAEYRYPLYRKPANFDNWSKPHPTRAQLEGKDGLLGNKSILAGNELVWMSDRLEAFLVQVQGSARLQLTDGTTMSVGYGGTTNYPYTSLGKELVKEGIFTLEELTLPKLLAYFQANPEALDKYIPRNKRFVFFRNTEGKAPTGNLGVEVTGDRSIATDKSLMPPGGLALIVAPIPVVTETGEIKIDLVDRFVLDQDTGSAIKGTGRVDVFLGSGTEAGERAGLLHGDGRLYYLLLKE
ncbi:MAG: murein transglycosylase A [Xenococcaceae cyanobacterium MO_188.B32]|nr:murein transglycosylase A [Xenococcaceae cyanobacterium MO_188.B32]